MKPKTDEAQARALKVKARLERLREVHMHATGTSARTASPAAPAGPTPARGAVQEAGPRPEIVSAALAHSTRPKAQMQRTVVFDEDSKRGVAVSGLKV